MHVCRRWWPLITGRNASYASAYTALSALSLCRTQGEVLTRLGKVHEKLGQCQSASISSILRPVDLERFKLTQFGSHKICSRKALKSKLTDMKNNYKKQKTAAARAAWAAEPCSAAWVMQLITSHATASAHDPSSKTSILSARPSGHAPSAPARTRPEEHVGARLFTPRTSASRITRMSAASLYRRRILQKRVSATSAAIPCPTDVARVEQTIAAACAEQPITAAAATVPTSNMSAVPLGEHGQPQDGAAADLRSAESAPIEEPASTAAPPSPAPSTVGSLFQALFGVARGTQNHAGDPPTAAAADVPGPPDEQRDASLSRSEAWYKGAYQRLTTDSQQLRDQLRRQTQEHNESQSSHQMQQARLEEELHAIRTSSAIALQGATAQCTQLTHDLAAARSAHTLALEAMDKIRNEAALAAEQERHMYDRDMAASAESLCEAQRSRDALQERLNTDAMQHANTLRQAVDVEAGLRSQIAASATHVAQLSAQLATVGAPPQLWET